MLPAAERVPPRPRPLASRPTRRVRSAALAVLLALAAVSCGGERRRHDDTAQLTDASTAAAPTRGYVVISIDTLRADHLGCYGYAKPTSPFLDELARRGTLFEEAYAQYPSTLVSHMSMFTGLYPREHGVIAADAVLAPQIESLPEVFQRAGFRTAGFTEGGYVSGRYGFRRGFDTFVARDRAGERPLARTFARGVEFLAGLPAGARFFLFLHTYAVHSPYDAPERYRLPFWPGPPPAGGIDGTPFALNSANATEQELSPAAIEYVSALYDAGIRETDETLRRFFAELARLGLAGDTTVVVTSDHGEELRDHGRFHHTQLYREVLRVPLIVVHPRRSGGVRQRAIVQLVDLAPTLYDLAGLRPKEKTSGVSRAGLVGTPAPAAEGSAWAEGETGERALYRAHGGAVESLLLFDPPAESWTSRSLSFDIAPGPGGGELAFEARAFGNARQLRVSGPAGAPYAQRIATEWTPVRLPLAAAGRVRLEVDGCAAPPGAKRRDALCYGFQLRGLRPVRMELYDLAADPAQRHDLARTRGDASRRLARDLLAFRPRPRAGAVESPLDAELAAQLEALGYAGQVRAAKGASGGRR
ncbi:MAG TPA: sulfatase [Thermoanaerobaculia bacterium]|nr:sulfatase [Thermoanaerobaculia bacterium]